VVSIVIVGGGVMGRLFTGWLAQAGHRVGVIDTSPQVVQELNERGVWIEERDGSVSHVAPCATTDAAELESPEILFLFVKTEHTGEAADHIAPVIRPDTAVVTLQNGFGNAEALAARVPAHQIVYGPTEHGGSLRPDGHVVHAHGGDTCIGPYIDGADMVFTDRVAAVLRGAGVSVTALPDVRVPLWQKRIFAASVLPVAALTGLRAGGLVDERVFGAIAVLVDEAVTAANAAGCCLDLDEEIHRIQKRPTLAPHARASMLQDLHAHRDTEIDAITGAIAKLAAARHTVAPASQTMTALVHGRELAWRAEPSEE
jgi:2-dehydropantoate 2-reductase